MITPYFAYNRGECFRNGYRMSKRTTILTMFLLFYSTSPLSAECVVLLHGLARTAASMSELEEKLTGKGYYVANVDYPSREKQISQLSEIAVTEGLTKCQKNTSQECRFHLMRQA